MSVAFEQAWAMVKNEEKMTKNEEKGKFQGYSKNTVSGRSERAAKARAWNQSRKVQRGRTRKRYSRNKSRGNVRPKMRRQLGAGGSRSHISKASEEEMRVVSLGGIDPRSPLRALSERKGAFDITRPDLSGEVIQRPMRIGEFFAGEGGQRVTPGGFGVDPARRGHKHATSDIGRFLDAPKKDTLTGANFDFEMDIRDKSPEEWVDSMEEVLGGLPDVLVGAPTCVDMSTQSVGSKWDPPTRYTEDVKAAKQEAWDARNEMHGEAPSWMNEWNPVYRGMTTKLGRAGTNTGSAKLFEHMWRIAEELVDRKDDAYVMLENPTSLARYMPFTFSSTLPDIANINMSSYTSPAAGVFGIPDNLDPVGGVGLDPLESSILYATQQTPELTRVGDIRSKPLKRTDIFGKFPKSWMPRPRLGQLAMDPEDDILSGTIARYNDISQLPQFRRKVPALPEFMRDVIEEGMRSWSPRQMEVNSSRMQPWQKLANRAQLGGPLKPGLMGSAFSGSLYPYAPAGSNRGVNQTRGFSYINPRTGEKVSVPAYHARSVFPSQLGADFMRAAEKDLRVLPPVTPETEFHMTNPNDAIRDFLSRGGINTTDKYRAAVGDRITDWLISQGYL